MHVEENVNVFPRSVKPFLPQTIPVVVTGNLATFRESVCSDGLRRRLRRRLGAAL